MANRMLIGAPGGRRQRWAAAALVLAFAGCAPGAAVAASWYGAPAGEGNGDCSSAASACPLLFALATASPGDTVYALSTLGGYDPAADVTVPSGVTLAGLGAPATIRFQAGSLHVQAGASAANLELVALAGASPPLVLDGAAGDQASGDRLLVSQLSPAGGQACSLAGATLTNSVCVVGTTTGDFAAEATGTDTLRGDDLWGGAVAALHALSRPGAPALVSLASDIVRGGAGASDLQPDAQGTRATILATHSNFAAVRSAGTSGLDAVQQDGSDQSAPPRLTDPAQSDFTEQPGSPTLGAGFVDPADGATDLAGGPRTLTTTYRFAYGITPELGTIGPPTSITTTDIGALEAAIGPQAALLPATGVSSAAATLHAALSPDGGPTDAVSAAIGGLDAARTYFFELTASSAAGATATPLLSFTTAPLPPPPRCRASAVRAGGAHRRTLPVWRLRLSCPAAARATVQAQLREVAGRGARMRTVRLATPLGPLALAAGAAVTRSLPLSPAVRRALAHVSRDRLILIVTFRSIFGAEAVTLVLRG